VIIRIIWGLKPLCKPPRVFYKDFETCPWPRLPAQDETIRLGLIHEGLECYPRIEEVQFDLKGRVRLILEQATYRDSAVEALRELMELGFTESESYPKFTDE
jgi:hypothetical protein